MRIEALLEAAGKEPTKANRVSLVGSLGGYVRKGKIFTRPAPSVFGLVELEEKSEEKDVESDGEDNAKPFRLAS